MSSANNRLARPIVLHRRARMILFGAGKVKHRRHPDGPRRKVVVSRSGNRGQVAIFRYLDAESLELREPRGRQGWAA